MHRPTVADLEKETYDDMHWRRYWCTWGMRGTYYDLNIGHYGVSIDIGIEDPQYLKFYRSRGVGDKPEWLHYRTEYLQNRLKEHGKKVVNTTSPNRNGIYENRTWYRGYSPYSKIDSRISVPFDVTKLEDLPYETICAPRVSKRPWKLWEVRDNWYRHMLILESVKYVPNDKNSPHMVRYYVPCGYPSVTVELLELNKNLDIVIGYYIIKYNLYDIEREEEKQNQSRYS